MAVPDAAFGWPVLKRAYMAAREADAKDGLAVALAAAATISTLDDLIELVHNPQHGDSRLLLLPGLKRLNHPRARATLEVLNTDTELGTEARRLLEDSR